LNLFRIVVTRAHIFCHYAHHEEHSDVVISVLGLSEEILRCTQDDSKMVELLDSRW